jgi:hypothetical protein
MIVIYRVSKFSSVIASSLRFSKERQSVSEIMGLIESVCHR